MSQRPLVCILVVILLLAGCAQQALEMPTPTITETPPTTERQTPTPTPQLVPTYTPTVPTSIVTTTLIVNSTEDSDDGSCDAIHCSLREAINAANEKQGPDMITFEPTVFQLSQTAVIALASALPPIIDGNTTIDATGAQVIIDGSKLVGEGTHGFVICNSSGNTLKGFTIQHVPGGAICVHAWYGNTANDNTLDGLRVINCGNGGPPFIGRTDAIWIQATGVGSYTCRNRVVNCTVVDNADDAITVQAREGGTAYYNLVSGDTIIGNGEAGVEIDAEGYGSDVSHNRVADNTVYRCKEHGGIIINCDDGGRVDDNMIHRNIVVENIGFGIGIIVHSPGSSASANTLVNNTVERTSGIGLSLNGDDTGVCYNNVIGNERQAADWGNRNRWHCNSEGNYWSDYTGKDENGDGIGDSAYVVLDNGVDNYPLMDPYESTG